MALPDPIQPSGTGFLLTCPGCGDETYDARRHVLATKQSRHLKTCKKKGDT